MGGDPFAHHGYVNPPSTMPRIVDPSAEDYIAHAANKIRPPRHTDPEALREHSADIEAACEAVALLPSGLAAISAAILSVVRTGDHILVTDSAYGPTRKFLTPFLPRYA